MLVNSGHINDPLKCSGLSHFLEHMIFINSEKQSEIDGTLNIRGFTNAKTYADTTLFNFQHQLNSPITLASFRKL